MSSRETVTINLDLLEAVFEVNSTIFSYLCDRERLGVLEPEEEMLFLHIQEIFKPQVGAAKEFSLYLEQLHNMDLEERN